VRNIHAHSIFDTKDRHGVFANQILDRCEQIVQKVCTDFDGANYAGSTANTTTRPPTRALPVTFQCALASAQSVVPPCGGTVPV
jgi:hypothetical protein